MTRKEHLTFCAVCTNRKFTQEFGFLCNLTNAKADFNNDCPDFKLDIDQKRLRDKKFRDEIDLNIRRRKHVLSGLFENLPHLAYLRDTASPRHPVIETGKETVVTQSRQRKKPLLFVIAMFPFVVSYSIYQTGTDNKNFEWYVIGFLVIWLLLILLYRSNEEIFRIGKQGIIVKKREFVPWNVIDFIHFKEVQRQTKADLYLVLKIADSEDKEIDLEYAERDLAEIGELVYQYMNRYKRN